MNIFIPTMARIGHSYFFQFISLYAKYQIFEKQSTKLLSWKIYILIDFMLTTWLTLRTTGRPKRHLKNNFGDS